MVENHQYRLKKSEIQKCDSLPLAIKKVLGNGGLRWYISEINDSEVVVEASTCDALPNPFLRTVTDRIYPGRSVALNIIPTGVGCHFGGFAGDAAPVTNLLASAVDYLVTNPNAVNASNFISDFLDRLPAIKYLDPIGFCSRQFQVAFTNLLKK